MAFVSSIAPAADWYHVSFPTAAVREIVVQPIAAWQTTENGGVIGLIPVQCENKQPRLAPPPPIPGAYKHQSQLTDVEKDALTNRRPVAVGNQ